MLGNKIGEEHGKVTSRRALQGDEQRSYMKLESSFETQVELYGVQGMNIGTFVAYERGPGQLYCEGQGILMTSEGEGAIWNGHGGGRMDEQATMHVAVSVAVQTTAQKLAALNGLLALVEVHVKMDGQMDTELYEWKA